MDKTSLNDKAVIKNCNVLLIACAVCTAYKIMNEYTNELHAKTTSDRSTGALKSRDLTTRHHIVRVDIARPVAVLE